MKVRMKVSSRAKPGAELDPPGKVVTVGDADGNRLIAAGLADLVAETKAAAKQQSDDGGQSGDAGNSGNSGSQA